MPEDLDPRIVHLLDQESAAFNESKDMWMETYGFEHNCTCDSDYTEGRVGEITACYAELCEKALEYCAIYKQERDQLVAMLNAVADKLPDPTLDD